MTESQESAARNPRWKTWYPSVLPDFKGLSPRESKYGEPLQETLALFHQLSPGSRIVDVGAGDGRYALPLSQMGHQVLAIDVDLPHLKRIRERRTGLQAMGQLTEGRSLVLPVQADVMDTEPALRDGTADAVLNTGFGYLIPPGELNVLFGRMTSVLRPGGLMVFEFATDRDRRDLQGNDLSGENEYNYSYKEGLDVLEEMFEKHGIENGNFPMIPTDKKYSDRTLRSNLIIASGRKVG